jgi:hypothetical protein
MGVQLLQSVNMLEGFPLGDWGREDERSLHTVLEVLKRASADRAAWRNAGPEATAALTGKVYAAPHDSDPQKLLLRAQGIFAVVNPCGKYALGPDRIPGGAESRAQAYAASRAATIGERATPSATQAGGFTVGTAAEAGDPLEYVRKYGTGLAVWTPRNCSWGPGSRNDLIL